MKGSYHLRTVANGWILTFIDHEDPGCQKPEYVFETLEDVHTFLAQRHGERVPKKLVQDWN